MSDPVDWSDPCARAAALTSAYYNLVSGGAEVEIRTRTLDAEELVRFAAADLDTLRAEMRDAQTACAAAKAGQPLSNKRFAIRAGYRRRCPPFGFPFGR